MSAPPLTHRLEGPPGADVVLLLNGGMMTFASWDPVAELLRPRLRLLGCDFRGQLLTPDDAPRELSDHADDLLQLLDHLELERVHLVGASFGAEVGLLFAACHPERVRSLIAVTATDHADEGLRAGVQRLRGAVREALGGGDRGALHDLLIPEVFSREYVERHGEDLAARRGQIAALPDSWFRGLEAILSCTERLDVRPFLPAIRCPALVVLAADDRVMAPERSRALARAIPGAATRVHGSSGHALVAEDPQWLGATCVEFLEQVQRREAGSGEEPTPP